MARTNAELQAQLEACAMKYTFADFFVDCFIAVGIAMLCTAVAVAANI